MSQRDVERTLGRLLTDDTFRTEFFDAPARATLNAGLDLSREESSALESLPRDSFADLGSRLDDRIRRAESTRGGVGG